MLQLDGPNPCILLAAKDAKNSTSAEIPLKGDLVDDIREWLKTRQQGRPTVGMTPDAGEVLLMCRNS